MILFTLEQAEAKLPWLREEIAAMQRCKQEIDAFRGDLSHAAEKTAGNGHVDDQHGLSGKRRHAEALVDELNERLARINAEGIELKSLDDGLVDFPSDRGGRIIYLCWKLGEDHVAWWHERDAGFAGRQPL